MDEALRRAERGTDEGTVVVAETQTASRGRHGRTWVSRSGNLYLSLVLYPTLETLPHLNSLCGVAVVRAITHISGLKPRIKWPNDILLDGKKSRRHPRRKRHRRQLRPLRHRRHRR